MKKIKQIVYLTVVFLFLGSPLVLCAADTSNTTNDTPKTKRELRQEQLKKLTPDQRESRQKLARQRAEKRLAQLRKKKADGSITPTEQKQLDQLEEVQKHHAKLNLHPTPGAQTPATGDNKESK